MKLSKELTSLVRDSVAVLGEIIQRELGLATFNRIEALRTQMAQMRTLRLDQQARILNTNYQKLRKLKNVDLHHVAHSFTLMLELMNACENAYRTHRLSLKSQSTIQDGEMPEAVVYVLTAHPTEARAPQNISIFHEVQHILNQALRDHKDEKQDFVLSLKSKTALTHALEIAWRTHIVRTRSPKVRDEADHIYSLLFRDKVILNLLDPSQRSVPFFVRSWVGGDKDGHPGVNEKTLFESLSLSRNHLVNIFREEMIHVRTTLDLFKRSELQTRISRIDKLLYDLKKIKTRDSKIVRIFLKEFDGFQKDYVKEIGASDPRTERLAQLLVAFPGLVVPIELRESSDVLMSKETPREKLAIFKMLKLIQRISHGSDPRDYARGFIISMTESVEHIKMAALFQKQTLGAIKLPIIPLFEQSVALGNSHKIIEAMIKDPSLRKAAQTHWENRIEMMVGYSDSSKEAGVLASRLEISEALPRLEKVCAKAKFIPIFFHGSGGSIDRGGGSIEDQTAWWPKSALRYYKVTVQGEMVERSLASPLIAERQVDTIIESAARGLKNPPRKREAHPTLDLFAEKVSKKYRETITSQDFLHLVEVATPYSYLNILKIGSRPTKRSTTLTVQGLRAIPWVLCWTQTRVLFQTWWGVGSAWQTLSVKEKSQIKQCFKNDPVFTSYVKALGFTLAKIELSVWRLYLEQSGLSANEARESFRIFEREFSLTAKCFRDICGEKDFMWAKPWLGESISLRSPMIHPLNMIQILARKKKDLSLLRLTVTGISSGMMTTG